MTVLAAYRLTLQKLGQEEGRWLFEAACGMDMQAVLLHGDAPLDAEKEKRLQQFTAERLSGRPLQYVLGTQDFMGLTIRCDERALIPRLDTECVCEAALRLAKENGYRTALDLCCGTGAIGLALQRLGGLAVTLADISEEALSLAQENAQALEIPANFVKGDLYEALFGCTFDLIVCNPPYIPSGEIAALEKQVQEFEPHLALDGGADGLDFYRRLARETQAHLNPHGAIVCEIGMGQEDDVCRLFAENGFLTRTDRDWQGIIRTVIASLPSL